MKRFLPTALFLVFGIASGVPQDTKKDGSPAAGRAETQENRPCLVVSQTGNWLKGETYQYQAGKFPPGVKFRVELRNRHLRELYRKGARVIVLNKNYTFRDLEDAKKSCTTEQPAAPSQEPH